MKMILFGLISFITIQSKAQWNITGNAGTNADSNFIGTTDNVDLIFKRENIRAGLLNNDKKSTSFGVNALNVNSSGSYNTALGFQALNVNTTGYQNTANGAYALSVNTIGINNTAIGSITLQANTTGGFNTAIGVQALNYNTTGSNNTANGVLSLRVNTTGINNTAIGVQALNYNTTGNHNTATGRLALNANTTGSYNTANGLNALYSNTTGYYNTVCGYNAGIGITTGSANTILGANVSGLAADLSNTVILADGNGNKRLYINSSGNVGIGTTNPQSKLAVNGTITAKQVKVTQTGWPDYVFDKDYKLMHLDSLSHFIQQHKHLPEIPSTKDIQTNGVDVGTNQVLLLKKIEELTLYIIEQHQQIEKQNEQLLEQQKKIVEQNKRIQKLENK